MHCNIIKDISMMDKGHKFELVISIDFGTTFSGYAYAYSGSEEVIANQNWLDAYSAESFKAPTSVLFKNNKAVSFGYEAVDTFLQKGKDDSNLCLFRDFKLILHKKEDFDVGASISSTNGDIKKAIDVFSASLKQWKDKIIDDLSKGTSDQSVPQDEKILWILTVPAIWSDSAKEFMRQAAIRSNIVKEGCDNLLIALEPEAASFYCRTQEMAQFSNPDQITFRNGTKYIILDLGGGTNDMVAHKVVLDDKISEICPPQGGVQGGNKINEKFVTMLKENYASIIQELLGHKYWHKFMSNFERQKKTVRDLEELAVDIPKQLMKIFRNVPQFNANRNFRIQDQQLILDERTVQELFRDTINEIIRNLRSMLDKAMESGNVIDYIFMVGGFSQSFLVHQAVEQEFGMTYKVLVPHEAQIAVMKGAVQFGLHQDTIVSRVARRTYGFYANIPFKNGMHKPEYRFRDADGDIQCDNVFLPVVNKGEQVEVISKRDKIYSLLSKQTGCSLPIYSVDRLPATPVEYTTASDMTKLGEIVLKTEDLTGGANRKVVFSMSFGRTEILVEGYDQLSKEKVALALDFMCDKTSKK